MTDYDSEDLFDLDRLLQGVPPGERISVASKAGFDFTTLQNLVEEVRELCEVRAVDGIQEEGYAGQLETYLFLVLAYRTQISKLYGPPEGSPEIVAHRKGIKMYEDVWKPAK